MPMGRLADLVGRKRVYLLGFALYAGAAALAAFAPNIGVLIGVKVAQGVGAAMTQGTSMAMIVASFPQEERGKALGLQMSLVGAGGIAGPAIGGLIVGELGWRWVFFGTAGMGALSILSAFILIDAARAGQSRAGGRFDWIGALLSTVALIAFLNGMTWSRTIGYGHPLIVGAFAAFIALCSARSYSTNYAAASPMMDVRLFKRRLFAFGVLASWLNFLGMQSVRFLMPFYLQAVLGLHPTTVGLIIVPGALCMMITGPLSGFLSDRIGWRWFTMGGMGISCVGLLILSNLQPDSPVPLAMAGMICQSMGVGFFNAPNNSSVLSAVEPSKHGAISGFLNLVRNSGNLCSIAIATAIVTATMGAHGYEPSLAAVSTDGGEGLLAAFTTGLRYAYLTMAIVVFLGIIASAFKGRTYELGEEPAPARQ